MTSIEQLIDHSAALQQDINRLNEEVLTLALAGLGLTILVVVLSYKLWHAS